MPVQPANTRCRTGASLDNPGICARKLARARPAV